MAIIYGTVFQSGSNTSMVDRLGNVHLIIDLLFRKVQGIDVLLFMSV